MKKSLPFIRNAPSILAGLAVYNNFLARFKFKYYKPASFRGCFSDLIPH